MTLRRARFEKWEGLGNDFVVLHAPGATLDDAAVRRLCDRRFGVGADGVLLVESARDGRRGPPRMIVRNADGSRPEMCGNGLRCVAGHLAEQTGDAGALVVLTDAGERACHVEPAGEDRVDVSVEMGAARPAADLVVPFEGREHRFAAVDMGNPHTVTFDPADDALIDALGPVASAWPPGGTNVEFCRMMEGGAGIGGGIGVVVWERGVGRTLACGTGACAVAAVACDTGRARFGEAVRVVLPGGVLEITVAPVTRVVRMRGPARRVFSGEVVLA
jgi:diaminopimelate epimerase